MHIHCKFFFLKNKERFFFTLVDHSPVRFVFASAPYSTQASWNGPSIANMRRDSISPHWPFSVGALDLCSPPAFCGRSCPY